MEVLDSLRQKKIKFFCPILDTSTCIPAHFRYKSNRSRNAATGIKNHSGAQFTCYDNGSVQSCIARYKSAGNGENSKHILREGSS